MFKTPTGDFLHHSFIVKGDESYIDIVKDNIGDNVIFNTYIEDGLTIDKVREIITHSEMVSRGGTNIYIIYFNSVSGSRNESQHSLLKALEEPKDNTIFILVTPNTSKLLDTIHSRCFYISQGENIETPVDEFINLRMDERLKYVEKMVKKHKEGKVSRLDIINLMSGCIEVKKGDHEVCRRLVDIQKLMNSSSAAVKQVLESFAICLE